MINKKVNSLIKAEVLKKTVKGRSHLCALNLESEEAVYLLILNEIRKKKHLPELEALVSRVQELKQVLTIHLALKVGKRLIFVLEDLDNRSILEKSTSLSSYKLEVYDKQTFLNKLLDDEDILQNHLILTGYGSYYNYVKEIQEKLKIKYSVMIK